MAYKEQEIVNPSRAVPPYELEEVNGEKVEVRREKKEEKQEDVSNEANIEEFDTGSIRDNQDGKPRYDLIPTLALHRLAHRYAEGAALYGENNWKKGQPYSRVYASLYRHLIAWRNGEEDEDHMAAVAWNAMALMHFEEVMPELDDLDA